jgi:flagellar FliL protein
MPDMAEEAEKPKRKGGMLFSILAGVLLAVTLGGGGFFTVYSGMVELPIASRAELLAAEKEAEAVPLPVTAFIPLEQVLVTVGQGNDARQLALSAQLEVNPLAADSVDLLKPRIVDVMNTYLRAVSASEIDDPASLLRIRAQMLRRIQVVTGDDHVRDLLVSELILR